MKTTVRLLLLGMIMLSIPGRPAAGAPTKLASTPIPTVTNAGLPLALPQSQSLCLGAHAGPVTAVAFSPDGQYFASGGADGVIKVWSMATKKIAFKLPDAEHNQNLVTTVPGKVPGALLTRGSGRESVMSNLGEIRALCFSPDGQTLFSGDANRHMGTWTVAQARLKTYSTIEVNSISSLAMSAAGKLAVGRSDGEIEYHLGSSNPGPSQACASPVAAIFWEPDARHYDSVDAAGHWRRWLYDDIKLARSAPADGMLPADGRVTANGPCALSADHRVLAVIRSVNGIVRVGLNRFPDGQLIVDALTGEKSAKTQMRCVAITPDGRTVLGGGADGWLYFWDTTPMLAAGFGDNVARNSAIAPSAPDAWPPLTKRSGRPGTDPNATNWMHFQVTCPDTLVIGIRRIENGKVTTEGDDMRLSQTVKRSSPPFNVPSGQYALFWRKLLEPGIVHQYSPSTEPDKPTPVTVYYERKVVEATTVSITYITYTRDLKITLDGKTADVQLDWGKRTPGQPTEIDGGAKTGKIQVIEERKTPSR